MKQITTLLIVTLLSINVFAGQNKTFAGGTWTSSMAWTPVGVPVNGDVVVIPANQILEITSNLNLSPANFTITVQGTLRFVNAAARLNLGAASSVTIAAGGRLETVGNGGPSQRLIIGSTTVWSGQNGNITTQTHFGNPVVLPVVFSFFRAELKNGNALLTWATAQEQNAKSFVIERSTDGSNWIAIGSVKAAGTSNTQQNYSFTDNKILTGKISYRIKQLDIDGRFEYTALRSVTNSGGEAVQIRAINGQVTVQFASSQKNITLQVVSLNGQVISKQVLSNPGNQVVINSNFKGAAVVAVQNANGTLAAQQILL